MIHHSIMDLSERRTAGVVRIEGIEDEERRSGSLVDGERPVTNRIIDTRMKDGYNRIIMLAHVFDLGWAQLYSMMFT
jgi:hypothetical protein